MVRPTIQPTIAVRNADPDSRDTTPWALHELPPDLNLAAAEAWCRRVAESHYENFTVASRIVPARLRQDLAKVYAYARWSDDLADEAASPAAAGEALQGWRRRLESCFAGRPDHPLFVALADTARRTAVGIEPFAHLLDAFDEDQRSMPLRSPSGMRRATTWSPTVGAPPIRSAASSSRSTAVGIRSWWRCRIGSARGCNW